MKNFPLLVAGLTVTLCMTACIADSPNDSEHVGSVHQSLSGTWSSTPPMPAIPDPSSGNFYQYAPSVVQTNVNTRFAYYCANTTSGVISDHIQYRTSLSDYSGNYYSWSAEANAIGPGAVGSFDHIHTCDPEYVQGTFSYAGTSYSLAMFYTGGDHDASEHNSIGVAYANAATGPWVKQSFPVIGFDAVCDSAHTTGWGVGQPSVTSVSGSHLMLFYTAGCCDAQGNCYPKAGKPQYGATHTYARELNLSTPGGVGANLWDTSEVAVPMSGLLDGYGSTESALNNISIIYDGARDVFFMARHQNPNPTAQPSYLSADVQVAFISGGSIWSGIGTWTMLGTAHSSDPPPLYYNYNGFTGLARNDNAGLLRNPYGGLMSSGSLDLFYTGADAIATFPESLWSHRILSRRLFLQ